MSPDTDRAFFPKEERLSKKKAFAYLFEHGSSFRVGVLSCFYVLDPPPELATLPMTVAFSVPKRKIKLAVHRNRVKRKMKEAYRLQRLDLYRQLADQQHRLILIFIYQPGRPLPFKPIQKAIAKSLTRLQKQISQNSGASSVS